MTFQSHDAATTAPHAIPYPALFSCYRTRKTAGRKMPAGRRPREGLSPLIFFLTAYINLMYQIPKTLYIPTPLQEVS